MSCLREIRLIIAQNLDLAPSVKSAVIDVLNALDASLDTEGYEPTAEVNAAIEKVYKTILDSGDVDIEDDVEEEEDDENEYIELDDIVYEEDDDEDEEEGF
jgi:hypothetical protein